MVGELREHSTLQHPRLEGGRAIKYGLRTLSHRFVDFLQLALRLEEREGQSLLPETCPKPNTSLCTKSSIMATIS